MELPFVRTLDVKCPVKNHAEDAGIDFFCPANTEVVLPPYQRRRIDLGVKLAIPLGYCLLFRDRSSMANNGIAVLGGVIDSGYRGELKVILVNTTAVEYRILPNDKIVQGLIIPVPSISLQEENELAPSQRSERGFGSSGR